MQQYKNTIALLGAAHATGKNIAKGTGSQYKLLLVDHNKSELKQLQKELLAQNPLAVTEITDSFTHASWEADIIIITAFTPDLVSLAKDIETFSTRKIVIQVRAANERHVSLEPILPHARIVMIQLEKEIAWIQSADEDAAIAAAVLMDLCGLLPICKNHSINTN